MDKERQNPITWLFEKFRTSSSILKTPPPTELQFAMKLNGFSLSRNGDWGSNLLLRKGFQDESTKFKYGVFGSNLSGDSRSGNEIALMLGQPPVLDVIRKYQELDEYEAKRIAMMLGIAARYGSDPTSSLEMARQVEFLARLTNLGGKRSGEAVASAMALNVFSDRDFFPDYHFQRDVYDMAEAITEDDTKLQLVEDLGISQALRLLRFVKKIQNRDIKDYTTFSSPDISQYRKAFDQFPTVGAEFHIPEDTEIFDNFWQRVALLNMSQYQRDTLIPFSRNDLGLIEIRMNPSIYPVAIATWNLMRLLLPELNQHYFTITLNRKNHNFSQKDQQISLLQSLGSLCYAAHFNEVPTTETLDRPEFGGWYLGQTVRVKDDKYTLVGSASSDGQLNLFTGFGNSYPDLAYYLSMALVDPRLDPVEYTRKGITPREALEMDEKRITSRFKYMNNYINSNSKLRWVTEDGARIISLLSP